ncbi:unnamed protein product [Kuraishia capsulata CBS 1993]|uniref:Uncharacterized protein n=1 Tax=Kuraishia capsulata CBS 1993 TaxID=1382522 RepID=W6MI77_9ASCO|nr:uncharacterized protein KUCA_T00001806001 [Kuraishia capsulata CBS 1993]CDK25836.1 unnamed protein product [Kuraishia capsulata CBS 1993]
MSATPRIDEKNFGESIGIRTNNLPQLEELGPPDLVHLSRYHKSTNSDSGAYHYVTGLDVSATAAPIAYLTTVQLSNTKTKTSSSASASAHPQVGTYCAYNCFSKGDLRIRMEFPGAVATTQFIYADRKKNTVHGDLKSSIWQETTASCLIRSVLLGDDIARQLPGMVKFNPIASTHSAKTAVEVLVRHLPKGPLCGASDIHQKPTLLQNHLVDALTRLVSLTNLQQFAIDQIDALSASGQIPDEFRLLKVKLLFSQNSEVEAVKEMHEGLIQNPRDGLLLNEQAKYLLSKGRPDLALIPATRAVESLPAEFDCWATLVEVHFFKLDYSSALLALNSCPMYSPRKKDIFKAIDPADFSFPLPADGSYDEIWKTAESSGCISGVGGPVTFAPASEIGAVDPLFLRIYQATLLQPTFKRAYDFLAVLTRQIGWDELLRLRSHVFVMEDEYRITLQEESKSKLNLLTPEAANGNGYNQERSPSPRRRSSSQVERFRKKRLCERWLDTLFIVLYDDLRVVLKWESDRRSLNPSDIKHSALEWELLGLSSFRTHHLEGGVSALKTCLNARFDIFAATVLLNHYVETQKNGDRFKGLNSKARKEAFLDADYVLELVTKVAAWNYRWYGDFSPLVLDVLKLLVEYRGTVSLSSTVHSKFDKETIPVVIDRDIAWLEQFEVEI